MQSKKVKLLFYPEVTTALKERRSSGMGLFPMPSDRLGDEVLQGLERNFVFFSFTKIKDLEATVRTLVEATSWMDWWVYAAKS